MKPTILLDDINQEAIIRTPCGLAPEMKVHYDNPRLYDILRFWQDWKPNVNQSSSTMYRVSNEAALNRGGFSLKCGERRIWDGE